MPEPKRISPAMQRVIARRAMETESKKRTQQRIKLYAKRLFQIVGGSIGFLAALAAIFGVWAWTIEAPDRAEERRVRRSQLLADARETVAHSNAKETIDTSYDPGLRAAIQTLIDFEQPIMLSATGRIQLGGLDIRCAEIDLRAPVLDIVESDIRASTVRWEGIELAVRDSEAFDVDLSFDLPPDRDKDSVLEMRILVDGFQLLNGLISVPARVRFERDEFTDASGLRDVRFIQELRPFHLKWLAIPLGKFALNDACTSGNSGADQTSCGVFGPEPAELEPVPREVECRRSRWVGIEKRMRDTHLRVRDTLGD